MKRQGGFTLVEIAIVLVIIGLLLGGVLKGQELINSAKVKNIVADMRTTATLVYAYQDRFKIYPGDETQGQLDSAFGMTGTTSNANQCTGGSPTTPSATCAPNNGRIDGDWDASTDASESFVFWQHVRLANLATGPTSLTDGNYAPRNADGGRLGIESGLDKDGKAAPFIAGMRGSFYVCTNGVLGRFARQIDTTMDDGNTAGGSVQVALNNASRGATAETTDKILDGQQYTVCAAF